MRKTRVKSRSQVLGSKEIVQNYEVKSGWFSKISNQTTDCLVRTRSGCAVRGLWADRGHIRIQDIIASFRCKPDRRAQYGRMSTGRR